MVHVRALAVAVEDHDQFGRSVDGCDGVWSHGPELGRLAGLDGDFAFPEGQAHPSRDDEEPIVAGVDALLDRSARRFEAHLDGDGVAGRSAQDPGRARGRTGRGRADDDVIVVADVEERVEVDVQGGGQRQQDIEADGALARLDPTDRRRTEVGACGHLVEGQAQGVAQTPQPGPNHVLDVIRRRHHSASRRLALANVAN